MSKFEDQKIVIDAAAELALLTSMIEDTLEWDISENGVKTLKRIKDKLLEYYEIRG